MSLPLISDSDAVPTTWFNEVRDIFRTAQWADVTQYGVLPGNSAALNSTNMATVLASGAKVFFFPAGTYLFNDEILLPVGTAIIGQGKDSTILDFTNANGTFDATTAGGCIRSKGSLTSLGGVAATISANARSLTLSAVPGSLAQDDLILIYDSNAGSYHADRPAYHKGEFAVVKSVTGATVTLTVPILDRDGYTAGANITIYKMNPTTILLRDFTVIGRGSIGGNSTDTINVTDGRHIVLDNLKVRGGAETNIGITRCYEVVVEACESYQYLDAGFGNDYGLSINNCQAVRVIGGDYLGNRHGITVGGGDGAGSVVNRDHIYDSCHIRTLEVNPSNVGAFGGHGNTELLTLQNCYVEGLNVAGDLTITKGCIIECHAGEGIHFTELSGLSHIIEGNLFHNDVAPPSDRGAFMDIGGNSIVLGPNTRFGGCLLVKGNHMTYSLADQVSSFMVFRNQGATGLRMQLHVVDNVFTGARTSTGNDYGLFCDSVTGDDWNEVIFNNNQAINVGACSIRDAQRVLAHDNIAVQGGKLGIEISYDGASNAEMYSVQGNYCRGNRFAGILVQAVNPKTVARASIRNNVCLENNQADTGSSSTNAAISVIDVVNAHLSGNVGAGTGPFQARQLGLQTVTNLYDKDNHWAGSGGIDYGNVSGILQGAEVYGSLVWDPPSIAAGATAVSPDVTALNARLGDMVSVGAPYDLQGIVATAYVSASSTVKIVLHNPTAGPIDLASGTWRVRAESVKS